MKLQFLILKTLLLLMAAALLAGCQPTVQDRYAPVISTPRLSFKTEILGFSAEKRPIELVTMGSGPKTILIISTIHGDEDAGTPLVQELIQRLRLSRNILQSHTVLIVPVVNPDGRFNRTRTNANGVDLNRNFPTANRVNNAVNGDKGLTEPESQIIYSLIKDKKPARIVSIHQPLNCIDYDGPGEELARTMSSYCPLPMQKLGSLPGSLGSFAGLECGIPIITMELSAEDSELSAKQLWTKYGYALLAAITYPDTPY